jgi:hypothetical protein
LLIQELGPMDGLCGVKGLTMHYQIAGRKKLVHTLHQHTEHEDSDEDESVQVWPIDDQS